MKRNVKCTGLIFIILTAFLHSCKKEEIPTISTSSLTNITSTSAVGGGNITSDGNADVTSRGVCWSLEPNPTTKDSKDEEGTGAGQFVSNITGLSVGTNYHARAYATNSAGTAYGADLSFTTLGNAPECITQPASNISPTGVTLNGTINANHATANVTFEYGPTVEYGQTLTAVQSPVSGNSITNVSISLTGLSEGTTYHFRVKAINSIGSDEGEDMTFTTSGQVPVAITQAATNINTTQVTLNGIANANYSSTSVTFEYGTSTNYGMTFSASPGNVTGNTNTNVSAVISNLNPGTTYHFRVKATNSLGTTLGDDLTFTTLGQRPTVITQPATNVQVTTATLNGTVNANHLPTVFSFEYGLTSSYGNTASPASNQVTGTADVRVSINMVGLTGGTIYHYRVVATNQLGTTYGDDVTFTTDETISLTTNSVTGVTYNSAVVGGNLANDGGFAITSRGVCWSKNPNPTIINEHILIGSGVGSFTSQIKCLDEVTTYYVRAFATYTDGIVYGNQESFNTESCPIAFNPNLTYGTVMDIDGNCYKTIQIGDQVWMAENLRTSRCNDGTPIPNVTDNEEWLNLLIPSYPEFTIVGAYCWHNNDSSTFENIYGKLYNFGVAESGKLCPIGWHVPTIIEWRELTDPYLYIIDNPTDPYNPFGTIGNELMETGISHWNEAMGTNETGFSALPGGIRSSNLFNEIGLKGYYWSSNRSGYPGANALYYPIPYGGDFGSTPLSSMISVTNGFSIRCIKD